VAAGRLTVQGRDGQLQKSGGARIKSPMQRNGRMHREMGNGAVVNNLSPLTGRSGNPGFDGVGTVFGFPFFQCFVIATFGFYDFTRVRVFVDFDGAGFASGLLGSGGVLALFGSGWVIQNRNNIFKALIVFAEQRAQFAFEFDFLLKAFIAFHGFEGSKLVGKVTFELAVFSKF
jgi:hypothetical protein